MCDDLTQTWSLKLPQIVDEELEDYSVQLDIKLGDASTFIAYTDNEREFSQKDPLDWSQRPKTGVYVIEIGILDSNEQENRYSITLKLLCQDQE